LSHQQVTCAQTQIDYQVSRKMVKQKCSITIETSLVRKIEKLAGTSFSAKIEQLLLQALNSDKGDKASSDVSTKIEDLRTRIEEIDERLGDQQEDVQELNDWKSTMPQFSDDQADIFEKLPADVEHLQNTVGDIQQQLTKVLKEIRQLRK
jgi:methyl-accepting chemotaxis protein